MSCEHRSTSKVHLLIADQKVCGHPVEEFGARSGVVFAGSMSYRMRVARVQHTEKTVNTPDEDRALER